MKYQAIVAIVAVLLAGIMLEGCKKEEPQPAAPPAKTTPTQVPTPTTVPAVPTPPPATVPVVPVVTPTVPPPATVPVAEDAAAKEAQTSLDKILALIKDGKLDEADKMLKELESRMSSLPQPLQDKVKAARTALDAKKAAGGVKIPGLGG